MRLPRVLIALAIAGAPLVASADEVQLKDVPAAARRTIEQRTSGGKIKEIERETERGRTYYEVEFVRDGKEHELRVAPDGSVLHHDRD
jgi:uncharacterized membrane protein YkoI